MSQKVGAAGGGPPTTAAAAARAARLLDGQAKVTGSAGNFALGERAAKEQQRARDLFDGARDRAPAADALTLLPASAAATTGDSKHSPPRSWRDLWRFRRRRHTS